MTSDANPVLVEVTRAGRVESRHRGAVAIADAAGGLIASWGDVAAEMFPRSAYKMLQALPLVESGAAAAFELSDAELALACASHGGEPAHIATVGAWLRRIGSTPDDLACGPHLPLHEDAAHAMVREDEAAGRIHNNCSGKHAGFLTLARHLGAESRGYAAREHPAQQAVTAAIGEMAGLEAARIHVGLDGCSAPALTLPLERLAMAMARLADPSGLSAARRAAAIRLREAVRAEPFMVAGSGRACTALIEAARGGAVVKIGAEGVFTGVLPELGLGFALKIDDGATRAAECVATALLARLGVIDRGSEVAARFMTPTIETCMGEAAGAMRPSDLLFD